MWGSNLGDAEGLEEESVPCRGKRMVGLGAEEQGVRLDIQARTEHVATLRPHSRH